MLVEDLLVVEERHRAGVLRQPVEAVVGVHRGPGRGGVLVLELVEAVLPQVDQVAGQRELRQRLVLDLGDVGGAGAGLDRVLQLGVLVGAGAGVDHFTLTFGYSFSNAAAWASADGVHVQ